LSWRTRCTWYGIIFIPIQHMIKTIISLFDIHYPFNIDLSGINKFIKEVQPDEIILWWDQIDLVWVSKFYHLGQEEWMYEALKEIKWFEEILKTFKRISPKTKIIWIDGNHEHRIWEFVKYSVERSEILNIHKIFKPYVHKFIKYNDFYKTGKLYRTHWIYCNDNHAKKHSLNVWKNVIYWHMHEIQTYSNKTLVWDKPHIAKSRPCLCTLNPEYKNNLPSWWTNWLWITYIRENGLFDDYTITITNWKFIYWGKYY